MCVQVSRIVLNSDEDREKAKAQVKQIEMQRIQPCPGGKCSVYKAVWERDGVCMGGICVCCVFCREESLEPLFIYLKRGKWWCCALKTATEAMSLCWVNINLCNSRTWLFLEKKCFSHSDHTSKAYSYIFPKFSLYKTEEWSCFQKSLKLLSVKAFAAIGLDFSLCALFFIFIFDIFFFQCHTLYFKQEYMPYEYYLNVFR